MTYLGSVLVVSKHVAFGRVVEELQVLLCKCRHQLATLVTLRDIGLRIGTNDVIYQLATLVTLRDRGMRIETNDVIYQLTTLVTLRDLGLRSETKHFTYQPTKLGN